MQAMLFAAGMGTRLKPITDVIPKALVPIGDRPLIQLVMDKLVASGFDNIVVNVHHKAGQVKNFLELYRDRTLRLFQTGILKGQMSALIQVSDESEQLLETGGGIKKAQNLLIGGILGHPTDPILIHNVDILSNVDLNALYNKIGDADALLLVSERKTKRYLLFNEAMDLVGWTNIETGEVKSPYPEIRALSDKVKSLNGVPHPSLRVIGSTACQKQEGLVRLFAFSGIHVFSPCLFEDMVEWPDKFPIMDFYLSVCSKRKIKGYCKQDLKLLDVGKLDTLADAENFIES